MASYSMVPSCGHQRVLRQGRTSQLFSSLSRANITLGRSNSVGATMHPGSVPLGADNLTAVAADSLKNGNGLARKIMSDPNLEGDPLAFLRATEAYWKAMKQQKDEPHKKGPTVVTTSNSSFSAHMKQPMLRNSSSSGRSHSGTAPDFDVIMCGGTLGIMVALALQQQGFKVAVVEKRTVQGRIQEWNTSRHECQVLVDLGLMSQAELDATVVTEFNPIRCGFKGGDPLWVNDCLNIGVNPKLLIATLRAKFEAQGGVIYEHTEFKSAVVCPDGVAATVVAAKDAPADVGDTNRPNALEPQQQRQCGPASAANAANSRLGNRDQQQIAGQHNGRVGSDVGAQAANKGPKQLSCRLLLDCMGHYSPIVKQLRGRAKPQGMVLVVGGCATGFPAELNQHADLLYSMTDASADMQLFWEAFPAEGGSARTTYMFAYSDADPSRPSFEHLLDTYFKLMPAYQNIPSLDSIRYKRVLFGGFPCYGSSPLQPGFDRVLQLGDASASQSPLSFGGFGCMLRHVRRFTESIGHALRDDKLSRGDLSWIHAYQPSLSAAWLFQRSMSIGVGQLQQQQQVSASGRSSSTGSSRQLGAGVQSNIVPVSLSASTARIVHSGSSSSSSTPAAGATTSTLPVPAAKCSIGSGSNGKASNAEVRVSTFDRWSDKLQQDGHGIAAATAEPAGSSNSSSGAAALKPGQSSSGSSSAGGPAWLRKLALLPANHINSLLAANFSVMAVLGQRVLKPFLQDTLQLGPLALTMLGMMLVKPLVVSRVLCQVGPKVLFGWFGHFAALTAYTLAHWILSPFRSLTRNYTIHRILDLLKYGSSSDYTYQASKAVSQPEIARIDQALVQAAAAAANATQRLQEQEQQQYREERHVQAERLVRKRRQQQQEEREGAAALAAGLGAAA